MRHDGLDLLQVHYRRNRRVICGCLDIVQDYVLAQYAGKLVVYGMSRAGGDDAALDGFSYQCQVSDYVQQLVACRLVVPLQGLVHDISAAGGIHLGYSHNLANLVITLLRHLTLVNNDSVVQVTSLYEACIQQRLYLTHEYECAAAGNLRGEVIHVIQ